MEARFQFPVEGEAKHSVDTMTHEAWLTTQVNHAFEKFDSGESVFVEHEEAKNRMAERKTRVRSQQ